MVENILTKVSEDKYATLPTYQNQPSPNNSIFYKYRSGGKIFETPKKSGVNVLNFSYGSMLHRDSKGEYAVWGST